MYCLRRWQNRRLSAGRTGKMQSDPPHGLYCNGNIEMRTGFPLNVESGSFPLNVESGSFYILIIEISENGKNMFMNQRFFGFIAGNVIYYNID